MLCNNPSWRLPNTKKQNSTIKADSTDRHHRCKTWVGSPQEQSGWRTANATKEGVQAAAIIVTILHKREDRRSIIAPGGSKSINQSSSICAFACPFDSAADLHWPCGASSLYVRLRISHEFARLYCIPHSNHLSVLAVKDPTCCSKLTNSARLFVPLSAA